MNFNLDINGLLEQLASYLGTTVENIKPAFTTYLEWATRDVFIRGIVWTIVGIVLIIVGYKVLCKLNAWRKSERFNSRDYNSDEDLHVIGISLTIGIFVGAALLICFNIPKIINPQYHAVQDIMCNVSDKC